MRQLSRQSGDLSHYLRLVGSLWYHRLWTTTRDNRHTNQKIFANPKLARMCGEYFLQAQCLLWPFLRCEAFDRTLIRRDHTHHRGRSVTGQFATFHEEHISKWRMSFWEEGGVKFNLAKGRVPKLKSAKLWSLTIEGGSPKTKSLFRIAISFKRLVCTVIHPICGEIVYWGS